MKKGIERVTTLEEDIKKSGVRGFLEERLNKLRKGPLRCPFCKEVFNGLSELGSHLKFHCR
jgi:hypothetical protein